MTVKTFTSTKISSTHGTRKAAQAELARKTRWSSEGVRYTVEHTGPRLFCVIVEITVESEPQLVRHIMGGHQIQCRNCNGHYWYYTGRDTFSLHYECASCGNTVSPPSETGACQ